MMKVSIEVFPSSDPRANRQIADLWQSLRASGARGVSITFGALGAAQQKSENLRHLISAPDETCMHLTCKGMSWRSIDSLVESWTASGIREVLALRGDRFTPRSDGPNDCLDLVKYLVANFPELRVAVAGYPDPHPDERVDGPCGATWLAQKLDAGATRIVTQFCFETNTILDLRNSLIQTHDHVEFSVGVLPITDFDKVRSFAAKCQVPIPNRLDASFTACPPSLWPALGFGESFTQIDSLRKQGVNSFHLYSFNKLEPSIWLLDALSKATEEPKALPFPIEQKETCDA